MVKDEVRGVPVGQGGSQGSPSWSRRKPWGTQLLKEEVRGVPVGQGDILVGPKGSRGASGVALWANEDV